MEKVDATAAPPAVKLVPASPDLQALNKRIEQAIRRGSGGRIHKLRVDVVRGQVTLIGFCSSFYAKQLAQHAALPLVEGRQLVNQIEVW